MLGVNISPDKLGCISKLHFSHEVVFQAVNKEEWQRLQIQFFSIIISFFFFLNASSEPIIQFNEIGEPSLAESCTAAVK